MTECVEMCEVITWGWELEQPGPIHNSSTNWLPISGNKVVDLFWPESLHSLFVWPTDLFSRGRSSLRSTHFLLEMEIRDSFFFRLFECLKQRKGTWVEHFLRLCNSLKRMLEPFSFSSVSFRSFIPETVTTCPPTCPQF